MYSICRHAGINNYESGWLWLHTSVINDSSSAEGLHFSAFHFTHI